MVDRFGYLGLMLKLLVPAPGVRVILHTVAMTEFDKNEKMVEELITVAKKYVDIDAVLEDREFFSEPSTETKFFHSCEKSMWYSLQ